MMAGPRIPTVKKISNALFAVVQKAIPPAQRDRLAADDWVQISRDCDELGLKIAKIIDMPNGQSDMLRD